VSRSGTIANPATSCADGAIDHDLAAGRVAALVFRLASGLLSCSRTAFLHVLTGGTHSLAREYPDEVAALIINHLA
jgi:hypothetical protein